MSIIGNRCPVSSQVHQHDAEIGIGHTPFQAHRLVDLSLEHGHGVRAIDGVGPIAQAVDYRCSGMLERLSDCEESAAARRTSTF